MLGPPKNRNYFTTSAGTKPGRNPQNHRKIYALYTIILIQIYMLPYYPQLLDLIWVPIIEFKWPDTTQLAWGRLWDIKSKV